MATKLGTVLADFTTSLATALAVGGTSVTLQSATDDDGVALPNGRYFFTIDGDNSSKEHISCDLSGTSLTNIKSVSRQGTETTGVARAHRIGATVVATNFAHLLYINDLISGATNLDSTNPLRYDGTPTLTHDDDICTKKYADDLAIAGAPDASTTVKGISEEATTAEIDAGTATGGTTARLFVNPSALASSIYNTRLPSSAEKDGLASTTTPASTNLYVTQKDFQIGAELYGADAGSTDTYVVTLSPAPSSLVAGMTYRFKANTANTGACTVNFNSLGAKAIKINKDEDPPDNAIKAGQIVIVTYDGTNMQLQTPDSNLSAPLYSHGTFSRAGNTASGTQNVAHGLGVAPTRIRIHAMWSGGSARFIAESIGTYDGSTTATVWNYYDDIGSTSQSNVDTSNIIYLSEASGLQRATVTVDATNIILVWTKSVSPASDNMRVHWEAFA